MLLATVRGDDPPRIHPISVAIVDGRLLAFIILAGPKRRDLEEDGRYAMHSHVDLTAPDEVSIRGRATSRDGPRETRRGDRRLAVRGRRRLRAVRVRGRQLRPRPPRRGRVAAALHGLARDAGLMPPARPRQAARVTPDERRAFIAAHAVPTAPPIVPEITLLEGGDSMPLWEAAALTDMRPAVPPPYWAWPWAGGQALARYVLDHPELVRGRIAADIGTGGGVVAIAAALAGAARVDAIDIEPFAVEACRLNAAANGVAAIVDPIEADPTNTDDGWDVVLVGDLWYESEVSPPDRAVAPGAGPSRRGRPDRRPRAGLPADGRPRDPRHGRRPDDGRPRGHDLQAGPRAQDPARLTPPVRASTSRSRPSRNARSGALVVSASARR